LPRAAAHSAGGRATWRRLLGGAAERLGSELDARRIAERASGSGGPELFAVLDDAPTARSVAFFDAMVERRAGGEPLQYVVGVWAFRSLELLVDRRVLIPRPETEQVVEVALAELALLAGRQSGRALAAADMGTGSGAIALSLAAEVPRLRVWATDRSEEALAVARANLAGLGGRAATRVTLCPGSWFDALPPEARGRLDLLVSNPPYVAEAEVPSLPPDVAEWEPRAALVAGPTGLEAVTAVLEGAPRWLAEPGTAVLEIAPHQAEATVSRALSLGFRQAEVRPDLAGRDRVLVARR
jgi:release factor glutamine methyltransferase